MAYWQAVSRPLRRFAKSITLPLEQLKREGQSPHLRHYFERSTRGSSHASLNASIAGDQQDLEPPLECSGKSTIFYFGHVLVDSSLRSSVKESDTDQSKSATSQIPRYSIERSSCQSINHGSFCDGSMVAMEGQGQSSLDDVVCGFQNLAPSASKCGPGQWSSSTTQLLSRNFAEGKHRGLTGQTGWLQLQSGSGSRGNVRLHLHQASYSTGGGTEVSEKLLRTPASLAKDLDTESTAIQVAESWIEKWLPAGIQPFAHLARLDKPIGTWLLAWPCFWSIALAAPCGSLPDLRLLALFGAGSVLLRGAGCTVNDLLDRKIDAQVARTRTRPLAAGTLTPFQALGFLGTQLLLGLAILVQLNWFSQLLGASSLLLVFTYPLMKRFTYWPQAFLGLTFNWGALLGWAAVRGAVDMPAVLPLYLACISWTLVYDTIYAHQDKDDDKKVGVKSTALLFGQDTPYWLAGFSASTLGGLALAGHTVGLGWPFYSALLVGGGHLAWQVGAVNYNSRTDCSTKFSSNKWFGAIIFSGIVLGKLMT